MESKIRLQKQEQTFKITIMKTKSTLIIISLFALSFFFNSCDTKKKRYSSAKETFYVKVKIDGIEYLFDNMVFVNGSSLKVGVIAISPNDGNGKNMAIAIVSNDPEGVTGTITDDFTGVFFDKLQPGSVWDADGKTRTITILENNDNYIEGTFSFTGHDRKSNTTKEFTDGSFRARKPKKRK